MKGATLLPSRPTYRKGAILDAVMVDGKPHCPRCRVPAYEVVDYGMADDDHVRFVVVCPQCMRRVRYVKPIADV